MGPASAALALSLLSLLCLRGASQSLADDCSVFEAMYDASGKTLPWTRGKCCNSSSAVYFSGITPCWGFYPPCFACNGAGRVTSMDLRDQGLTSAIPANITKVTFLEEFMIGGLNSVTGQIPSFVGLANLMRLHLDSPTTTLTGNVDGLIPADQLQFCTLTYNKSSPGLYTCANNFPAVCLDSNQTIPRGASCGSAAVGTPIVLKRYPLDGLVEDCAVFLQLLHQSGGGVTTDSPFWCGSISPYVGTRGPTPCWGQESPCWAASNRRLIAMDLRDHKLSGQLPANLSRVSFLEELVLSGNNHIWGPLGTLANLTNLRRIKLDGNNSFSGNVDEIFSARTRDLLQYCDITLHNSNPGIYTCNNAFPRACVNDNQTIAHGASCPSSSITSTTSVLAVAATTSPTVNPDPPAPVGAILGGVIAAVCVLMAVAAVGIAWHWKRRRPAKPEPKGLTEGLDHVKEEVIVSGPVLGPGPASASGSPPPSKSTPKETQAPPTVVPPHAAVPHAAVPPHWFFFTIAGPRGMEAMESVPYEGGETHMVMESFQPNSPDEIALQRGNVVELRKVFRDGWAIGQNHITGEIGAFPLDCLLLGTFNPPKFFGSPARMESQSTGVAEQILSLRQVSSAGTSTRMVAEQVPDIRGPS